MAALRRCHRRRSFLVARWEVGSSSRPRERMGPTRLGGYAISVDDDDDEDDDATATRTAAGRGMKHGEVQGGGAGRSDWRATAATASTWMTAAWR